MMFARKRVAISKKDDNDVYGHKYNKIAKIFNKPFLGSHKAMGEIYHLSYPQCQILSNSDGDMMCVKVW